MFDILIRTGKFLAFALLIVGILFGFYTSFGSYFSLFTNMMAYGLTYLTPYMTHSTWYFLFGFIQLDISLFVIRFVRDHF